MAAASQWSGSAEEGLWHLAAIAARPTIERAVEPVRQVLGMDVAYATEFTDEQQLFRVLSGDGESLGVHEGLAMPLEQTYCQRVLAGELPALIRDVRPHALAGELPISKAADVGAFTSVPLRFADGRIYGTLCAASHRRRSDRPYRAGMSEREAPEEILGGLGSQFCPECAHTLLDVLGGGAAGSAPVADAP